MSMQAVRQVLREQRAQVLARRARLGMPTPKPSIVTHPMFIQNVWPKRLAEPETEDQPEQGIETVAEQDAIIESDCAPSIKPKRIGAFERARKIKRIIALVSRIFGVPVPAIFSQRRSINIVYARHAAIYIVRRQFPELSLPHIGRIFGRDHTSILSALRKIEAKREARKCRN